MATNSQQADKIHIVPYDPNWVKLAEQEIAILKKLFKGDDWVVDIQHIGSTAIPGLAAKPIIDIYLGVRSIKEAEAAIEPIKKLGYQYWADNPNKEKMFFVKGMPPFGKARTHHIHIVGYNSHYWKARMLFRDYLLSHPKEVEEYAKLKLELSHQHSSDREAYTDAKGDFVAKILTKAGFTEKVKR